MNNKTGIIMGGIIGLTVLFFGLKSYLNPEFRHWVTAPLATERLAAERASVATVQPQKQLHGVVTNFTPGVWTLVVEDYDPALRADVTLITPEPHVFCKARFDRDDNRVVMLDASNNPENVPNTRCNLEVRRGFYTAEVMVDPGQKLEGFKARWDLSPSVKR